jgi:hypothetical protein
METAVRYRAKAEELRLRAQKTVTNAIKQDLEQLAKEYDRLADQSEDLSRWSSRPENS